MNDFAAYLRRSHRGRVVVALSVPQGKTKPLADATKLRKTLGPRADVVVLSYSLAFKLTDALGKERSVYGGVARIYPCDDEWLSNARCAKSIFPSDRARLSLADIERAVDAEIERMQAMEQRRKRQAEADRIAKAQARAKARAKAEAEAAAEARLSQATSSADDATQRHGTTTAPETTRPIEAKGTSSQSGTLAPNDEATRRLDLPMNASGVFMADSAGQAAMLADYLRSEHRGMAVIISTRNTGMAESLADTSQLAKLLHGAVQVVDVIGPEATDTFNAHMPKGIQTFGNACRVFPANTDWITQGGIKLFWSLTLADRQRVTADVLREAARISFAREYASTMKPGMVRASGTVLGYPAAGRVLVDLGRGQYATILPDLICKDVASDRLFTKGMHVEGLFDEDSRRLDISSPKRQDPRKALAGYAGGMTVPARVVSVRRDSCTLELFPRAVVDVPAQEAGFGSDLRWELTAGDVVTVKLVETDGLENYGGEIGDDGQIRLNWLVSLLDAEDRVSPAPGYFPSGPSWITVPAPGQDRPSQADGDAAPAAVEADDQLARLIPEDASPLCVQRIRELYQQLVQTRQELEDMGHERNNLASQLEQARQRSLERKRAIRQLSKRKANDSGDDWANRFTDRGQRLDFEVYMAWVTRIPAADKLNKPLTKNWSYGGDFFDSLSQVQGVDRDKIAQVMLEVVLGLDKDLASRGLHQLRSGEGGDDAKRRTAEGDTYWRVYLQVNTPGARRMHYIRHADGTVTFTRVALHDDYRS